MKGKRKNPHHWVGHGYAGDNTFKKCGANDLDDNVQMDGECPVRPLPAPSPQPIAPGGELGKVFAGIRVVKVDHIPDDMIFVGEKLFKQLSSGKAGT